MNTNLRRSIQQILLTTSIAVFSASSLASVGQQNPPPGPGQIPDYFGVVPNFANSPAPILAQITAVSRKGTDVTATATGAAATTYDYVHDVATKNLMDIQGGTGYVKDDVLTITAGAAPGTVAASCTATVNNAVGGVILPHTDATGAFVSSGVTPDAGCTGIFTTPVANSGIRKFVDSLAPLGLAGVAPNNLQQILPVAIPDKTTFPGSDYYEIAVSEYQHKFHSDLPTTTLRGYKQLNDPTGSAASNNHYLGPIIVAQKGIPVRVKFVNQLPTGAGGKLALPVDTTYMGADGAADTDNRAAVHLHGGNTPWISDGTVRQWVKPKGETGNNKGESVRNVPDMWFDANGNVIASCAAKTTCSVTGASNSPGDGAMTYFFTNDQSARLMFYHDHAEGTTRLNVYNGEAAGFVLQDPTEQALVYDATNNPTGILPASADTIPLVIQEKTFVPDNNSAHPVLNFYGPFASQLESQDPTWRWGTTGKTVSTYNGNGDLWVPHVFMPNQNPGDVSGANALGRWDYGPWFWPPFTNIQNGEIPNPYYNPACVTTSNYCENKTIPGVPNGSLQAVFSNGVKGGVADASNKGAITEAPSGTPEAFNDTPVVNGTAYPYMTVDPKPYRFRILSVGNDRMLNLSLVVAASKNSLDTSASGNAGTTNNTILCDGKSSANPADCTEVKMLPWDATQDKITHFPTWWYTSQKNGVTFDGRPSGVFDPATRGPAMVQIGTEGGFLSSPAVIKNQPINYEYNPKNIVIGNVKEHALLLGPAERADVLVDFTNFAGSTLILYNDNPAPMPAWDLRLDYYTGGYDNTDTGGAFSVVPGYGPNSRTLMQIRVSGSGGTNPVDDLGTINMATLTPAIQTAFKTSQEPIIVPQAAYGPTYNTTFTDAMGQDLSRISDTTLTYTPLDTSTKLAATTGAITLNLQPKSIIEDWTQNWGRMNALLGVEVPKTTALTATSIPQAFVDPQTELVKITPNANMVPISGTAPDGTQIWKITHNGVDSHAIHFHLFHVQLINRVGWDGMTDMPAANELGWKDTVKMHPLTDTIVALRPMTMKNLPFKVPNSHRLVMPSLAAGAPAAMDQFNLDPTTGNASTVTNQSVNYGWEYLWHCHILGHEENDMMRTISAAQPPEVPVITSATGTGASVTVSWTDNSIISNWVTIQRSTSPTFATIDMTVNVVEPECAVQAGCARTYVDKTAPAATSVYYRIMANNTVGAGDSKLDVPGQSLPPELSTLVPGFAGYANVTANSDWSNTASRLLIPVASVSPSSIVFPQTAIGSTATNKVITISNTGAGTLNVSGISLTGPFARATTSGSCPTTATFTLAAKANCTYNVTFKPTAALCTGANCSGTLTVTDNSNGVAGTTQTVSLSGTTVQATIPGTPATPTTASVTATSLTLNWAAVTGATSYTVQRATSATGPWTAVGSPTTNTLNVTGLTGNTTYYFQVSATNSAGTSAYSAAKSQLTIPAVPTAVSAVNGTAGAPITAGLTWTAPTGGATSYNVRYSTSSLLIGFLSTTVTNVAPGQQITVPNTTRAMQVQAVNPSGAGAWSTTITVAPL